MEKNHSPVPKKEKKVEVSMGFPEAMRAVIEGKKIKRIEWEENDYYGFLNGDLLSLHKPDGQNYQWIVSQGDLFANDWEIIN